MANNNIEIEIKFPLSNPEEVIVFLDTHGKVVSRDIFQRDTYFIPAHRNFLKVNYPFEWLRLRETEKGTSINYKHFYPENAKKTDYCDEFETKIDSADVMRNIFRSLNIQEVVVVEKRRTTWVFEDVEIVIDDVKDLGSYIELEAMGDFSNPQDGKKYLYLVLGKLEAAVGEEDLRGYPFRILENKGYIFGK